MLSYPLIVKRTLSTGERVCVGRLAENKQGVFFQYDSDYLAHNSRKNNRHNNNLSPFKLATTHELQKAPSTPHYGLQGVFADSLPDGWGLYVMDRIFRQHGLEPQKITALQRLAFMGNNCLGALSYAPISDIATKNKTNKLVNDHRLVELGKSAIQEFEGCESDMIAELMNAGGSGGARPKLTVTKTESGNYSTNPYAVGERLIIKLTSQKFALQQHESLVEYLYLQMAQTVGIEVPEFELMKIDNHRYWLKLKRFDCSPISAHGRYHMISACGLLDASFREPSLDYVDLIKATRLMCGVTEARKLVKRALFNFLLLNQDDHSKNFTFLADDENQWQLSPCYDIVYSPSVHGEHATAFNGNGTHPDARTLLQMALQAGFKDSKPLYSMLDEIYYATQNFAHQAKNIGLPSPLINEIELAIQTRWALVKR